MKRAVTSSKRMDFSLSLNVFGNLRNNVSTQLNKMYNKGLAPYRNLNVEMFAFMYDIAVTTVHLKQCDIWLSISNFY